MDRATDARLIAISYSDDGLGRRVATETSRSVLCSYQSVNRAEFFSAWQAGLRAEIVVTMFAPDYHGEDIVDIYGLDGYTRYDVYRTYQKSDSIELWCCKRNEDVVRTVTVVSQGKHITLHGVYVLWDNGARDTTTGKVSTDAVTLTIPPSAQAFVGLDAVSYVKPKMYKALPDKSGVWTLDTTSFFVLADEVEEGTYQQINSKYDDCYRVESVAIKNRGKPNTEYLEVTGR